MITEDGYMLTIYRCYLKSTPAENRKPVLLVHGLLASSDAYVMNPGNESFGKLQYKILY